MLQNLKTAFCTICTLFLISPPAFSTQKSRHIFFWTHGIGGTAKQFGVLPEILKRELNNNQENEILFFPYEYETESDQKSVPEFKVGLANHINSTLAQIGGLQPSDQITVGGYSQGGLIAFNWLLDLSNSTSETDQKLLQSVHNFITVSTPFWGANIANIGKALKPFFGSWTPLAHFGKRQLEDMSIGSAAVFEQAHLLSKPQTTQKILALMKNIRFLQISGYFLPKTLSPLFPDSLILDEDLAVTDYSTPLSFYSYLETLHTPQNKITIAAGDFVSTRFPTEEHSAEGWHLTDIKKVLGPASDYFPDINPPSMVDVPTSCLNVPLENCRSGSTQLIVNFLKHKQLPPLLPIPRRYSIILKVHLSSSGRQELITDGYKNIHVDTQYSANLQPSDLHVTESEFVRQYTGKLENNATMRAIQMKIQTPGYSKKFINAPVAPGKTTLVEIYLERAL